MKKEEVVCLFDKKLRQGKSFKDANREIKQLMNSQREFKELKKEIEFLNKQNEKLLNENKRLKNKLFNLELLNSEKKAEKDKLETPVYYLGRVIKMMKFEKEPLTKTDLRKLCCFGDKHSRVCLSFLKKYGFIEEVSIAGCRKYKLK